MEAGNTETRLKEIEKEFLKLGIIDAPGCIMLGLGLYGKFGAHGNAFHPLLNDPQIVNTLLFLGGVIVAWGAYKGFRLALERARLENQESQGGQE